MTVDGLSAAGFRIFRLFLVDLTDAQLERVTDDARKELHGRIERDQGITRLFFTSLSDTELDLARAMIETERQARIQDGIFLGAVAAERIER